MCNLFLHLGHTYEKIRAVFFHRGHASPRGRQLIFSWVRALSCSSIALLEYQYQEINFLSQLIVSQGDLKQKAITKWA